MNPATTLVDLLRHGEPEGGPGFRGDIDDPLSKTGWQQMLDTLGEGAPWDAVVTSPLIRCAGFAEVLAREHSLPVHREPRLREIGFGAWEGKTIEQVEASWGQALTRFWSDPVANPPPGGEQVEAFQDRVIEAWNHWCEELAGQRILVICHGGVIRMILARVMGIPLNSAFQGLAVPYACHSRIRLDTSSHGRLACLISHGPGPGRLL
ncbi:alpha-ribazole phosphatase [Marinobacter daqiaonensis]|uniref:Alpha-ribazole phosphatase n=1 Tax=Marinobacter daqiaonensis TaxID=650891 RepID=A0A1I6JNE7_9GAMM|nr:alpha-ribazole phosphatase family protein [Marinobacter daqiaonensis]SFR80459.1 alpha-ribazole phosphatase [Marinobacter daqiaonensis]